jgi:glycosyltransferase involved in cell wall biosynthesis
MQGLVACWLWEAARWGGRAEPLRGAIIAEQATAHATGGRGPWVLGQWFAQLNLQPLLRQVRGGGTVWNELPSFEQTAPRRWLLPCRALDRFRRDGLRYLLLLPWLRRGGADRAALAYLRVLGERFPGQVLGITTEPVDSPWSSYVPPGAELVQWRDVADCAISGDRVRALLQFIVESRVQVLHVMNSMLGWQLLAEHGRQLRTFCQVYASLFWYGPSPAHQLLGYAADFLPRVEGAIDGVITDNEAFRERLWVDYGVPRARTWCVYHPTDAMVDRVTPRGTDAHPTVLWAGRFAPEKRLDVLRKVAEQLPAARFRVFGSGEDASGSEHIELERLRGLKNVTLEGAFDGFSALPYADADVLLYTSSSDGMPNIVVEAAAHGLAIVAPDVGGVSELVNAVSGWLVQRFDHVEGYLSALATVLGDPAERCRRAEAARRTVSERHTFEAFANQLAKVPNYLMP